MRADFVSTALAALVVSRDAPLPPEFPKTPQAKRSRYRAVVLGVSFVLVMMAGGCDMNLPDSPPTVIGDGIPDQSLDLDTNPTTTLSVYDYFTDPDPDDSLRFFSVLSYPPRVASADVSADRSMITITAHAPGTAEVHFQVSSSGYDISDRFTVTVTAPVCAGQSAETRDFRYPANEELDFTEYERDFLRRLHAEGWNGNGVDVVIMDYFSEDGSPSHGTAVANIVRRYAPNANFHYTGTTVGNSQIPPDVDQNAFHVVNRSFAVRASPQAEDRLEVPQSRARRDNFSDPNWYEGMVVYGAGNAAAPLPGGDPHRALPVLKLNGFVRSLAWDGVLHAKSAVLVVGAVDYRPGVSTDDGWVLSHDVDGAAHSPRAGAARHAFIVAPDDNRGHNFVGTSFAAPRVTGVSAILSQKCPYLRSEQIGYLLLRSARDLGAPGVDDVYGYGLMDVENAMARAVELMAGYDDFDSTIPPTADSP